MSKMMGFGTLFGSLGVILGGLIMHWVSSDTTSFSDYWTTFAGGMLPVMGVLGGITLGATLSGQLTPWPLEDKIRRVPFALVGAVFSGLGMHVAHVVVAKNWFVEEMEAAKSSLFYLLLHPAEVPDLVRSSGSGLESTISSEGQLILGIVVGFFISFYYLRRDLLADDKPETEKEPESGFEEGATPET